MQYGIYKKLSFWLIIVVHTELKSTVFFSPNALYQISISYYAWNMSKSLCAGAGVGGGGDLNL